MTRDQKLAILAYEHVKRIKELDPEKQKEYRTLVQGLGPLVLRSGLVTALAFLQRKRKGRESTPANLLFKHLAEADIPGLRVEQPDEVADQLCEHTRHLDLEETMLATRHLLKVVEWLKRAVEATLREDG